MRASKIEFRLRGVILTLIVVLGFWAPWIQALDLGKRVSLLEWLALELSRAGLLPFIYATPVVIVAGALLALLGMVLRLWGTAYLGPRTMRSRQMRASTLQVDGPYRYLRNPLYLGAWFMVAALAFLMPPAGALVAVPLITMFLLRLILAEEHFLARELGEPYQLYLRSTPRLFPRLRANLPRAGAKPHWGRAVLSELNPICVFVTLAVISWTYDHELMLKAILVGYGISLVGRALIPREQEATKVA
jgi:protein-S-isoprenylcysteine O-methyltransferase Ste14